MPPTSSAAACTISPSTRIAIRLRALLERLLRGELSYADTRLAFVAEPDSSEPVAVRFAVVRDARAHPRAVVATAHPVPAA